MTRSIDVVKVIDEAPVSGLQRRVVLLCFLVAAVDGFDAQAIAFVAPIVAGVFDISRNEMGPVLAAALVGLMAGAFLLSPLADRIGRKPVIIGSVVVMGIFSLATTLATSREELLLYRFLTGLGLGGVMPNINTLTSEYAPARSRATLMTVMFVGFPFGAVVGGLASAPLIEAFGWKTVFLLGGIVPLILAAVLWRSLPESVLYLTGRGKRPQVIARIIENIAPGTTAKGETCFILPAADAQKASALDLFTGGRLLTTLLLWVVFFANLLMMYALFGWLPTVLNQAGLPLDQAIIGTVIFNLGGVIGGLLIARAVDGLGPIKVMTTSYLIAAASVAAIGFTGGTLTAAVVAIFMAGATVVGAQFGMNALTISAYPTAVRSTGLGWALAVGRIGSIVGPIVVGALLARQLAIETLFIVFALPAFVSAGTVAFLGTVRAKRLNDGVTLAQSPAE